MPAAMLALLIAHISVFMPRVIYSLVYYLLLPAIVLRLFWRSIAVPAYRHRISERFGYTDYSPADKTLWVHAVSVGETLAAAPIVNQLLQRYPDYRILMTTTTPTGSERIQALFGDRVDHVYAPYDSPGSVQRFLNTFKPDVLIVMETELWPNMLHYCHQLGCKNLLANARMSARSARGYLRFGSLTRAMMADINLVAVQSNSDGGRLLEMGLAEHAIAVTGSIKFDVDVSDDQRLKVSELKQSWAVEQRSVFVAASTHEGEDELILSAFAELKVEFPDVLLVLVPRHPERFKQALTLCQMRDWHVLTRSSGIDPDQSVDIVLGDTMGELPLFLGAASVAFIGGSLVARGGHNMLEASAWGVPVLSGPHVFNFADISQMLEGAGALQFVASADELAKTLVNLIGDQSGRLSMGAAGLAVVEQNRGATEKLLALVDALMMED